MLDTIKYTPALIKNQLSKFSHQLDSFTKINASPLAPYRKSAVLVPLFLKDGEIHVLLTKRSEKMTQHKGEVAFPGGMAEVTDNDETDTCLRESEEEIGLPRKDVTIIGKLPPRITRHHIIIVPVVGIIPADFKATPNEEVDTVFTLPLTRFLSAEEHHTSELVWSSDRSKKVLIHFFDNTINGRNIITWGLTANMCVELAVAVLGTKPQFTYALHDEITVENPFHHQKLFLQSVVNDSKL